jgi:hypothetical protein
MKNDIVIRCECCDELSHLDGYSLPPWEIELDGLKHLKEKERNVVACKLIANMAGFFEFVEERYNTVGVSIKVFVTMRPQKEEDTINA